MQWVFLYQLSFFKNISFQGNSYGNFKGASGLKLQFYGNDKTMNLNPLILANIQNSPYFKVIPSRSGLRNLMILNFLRPSCLRCGHFTRWWTRSITRWITSSPGRRVPARLLAAAPPGCAEAWGVCPRGASRPPHFASSTNSTPSNWPKSRSAVKILKICDKH